MLWVAYGALSVRSTKVVSVIWGFECPEHESSKFWWFGLVLLVTYGVLLASWSDVFRLLAQKRGTRENFPHLKASEDRGMDGVGSDQPHWPP